MLTLNDGRTELWQWDTGRTLTVDADCSQVHFGNKVFGRSIDVDVVDGVAIIPDILLQTDKDLNVWAFVGTAKNGYTKISKTFKVNRRNKPADYVFTPQEQITLKDATAILEEAKDVANGAMETAKKAEASADNAGTDASAAKEQADRAQAEADRAEAARTDAEDVVESCIPDDTAVDGKPWTSKKIVDTICQPFEESGNPVQVYPVENYPLGVKASWEPVQEGSGDPSPDNIRPITGRDAVSVTRCGKNLAKHIRAPGYTDTKNGLTFTVNDDYSITTKGTATKDTYFDFISIEGENLIATYLLNAIGRTVVHNGFEFRDIVVQPSPRDHNTRLYLVIPSGKVVDTTYYPAIVYGSTATPYEPYTGSKTGIALPETVYGGSLDVETGVVTETWGQIASYAGEPLPGEWISDRDVYAPGAVPTTGAQVVYKLAEPITIQLTPQQIAPLGGVNTLYTDADGVVVTGLEDPRHTITELKNAIISLGGNV